MSLVDLGKQLLEYAKLGETEEVRSLMTNGAPFTTDWLGFSPLHLAAQYGHVSTAEVLLRAGISRDARTKVDRTPLHVAAQEGHLDVVELLINHGADVDAVDMLKMTPLHWAVERGHYNTVSLLLKERADATAMSKFDKTPLDIAEDNSDCDLIDLLQRHADTLPLIKSELVTLSSKKSTTVKSLPSTIVTQPSRLIVSSSNSTINSSIHTVKSPSVSKPVYLRANLADFQKATTANTSSRGASSSDSEEGEPAEQSCTNVLATLAALAEATAPNASISTADALHWLESHGIQMLPTDNSTIVASAVEGGQTVALTEAGKLALTFVKEHQHLNSSSVEVATTTNSSEKVPATSVSSTTNQKVITIVTDQNQIPSIISAPQTPIVLLSQSVSSNVKKIAKACRSGAIVNNTIVNSSPTVKKIKLSPLRKKPELINGNVIPISSNNTEDSSTQKLKQELETMRKQAELYKAQLLQKANEAELYKRQLEEMRTLPRVNQ